MAVYAVAQLRFTDREAYDRYQARFMGIFTRFSGQILAADEHPDVIEGEWERDKIVILSFRDKAAFLAWSNSPEYRDISRDRLAGSEALFLLVRGIDATHDFRVHDS